MKLSELLPIIQDEKKSEDYLRSVGILKTFSYCPRCNGTSLGMIRGDRWKCYKCKTEWTRRKDSILGLVRIKYSEFLLCIKLFELELTAEETANQLKINFKTVQLLFNEFRKAMSDIDLAGALNDILTEEVELLYIHERNAKIILSLTDINNEAIARIELKRHFLQKSAAFYDFNIGNINKMMTLKIKKNLVIFHQFLRFMKKRLYNFRGTGKKNLLLRLKEIEFRFNNQKVDIYDCIEQLISTKY
jgi:transposase-like protein